MTVCEHFKNLALEAVKRWDGQSDLELLKLLADILGSPFWLNAYFEANKNRWHDGNCQTNRERVDIVQEDFDKMIADAVMSKDEPETDNVIPPNWRDII